MLRRRREQLSGSTAVAPEFENFHEWVTSLPWVVERPRNPDTPGVRCFGVDCEVLDRRQLWLLTGMDRHLDTDCLGLAVIVPQTIAVDVEHAGLGRVLSAMPRGYALLTVSSKALAGRGELEALVLSAYVWALS